MKALVLSKGYPKPDGTHERMFVHVRNLYYKKNGIDVEVINFDTKEDYEIDGIKVLSLNSYKNSTKNYDVLISHASNLRNQYLFLKKYDKKFPKMIFFFHGHEVLYLRKSYPKPYNYVKNGFFRKSFLQDIYDFIKIKVWRNYFKKNANKSSFIFVSNWILNQFKKNLKLDEKDLNNNVYIVNNSIGSAFENHSWNQESEKKYDFITIRSHFDGSTYCVDLLRDLANNNSDLKFLLIGKGKFFEYNTKPSNLEIINKTIDHTEMFKYLDESKCGLLLTRNDTQGVMTCEMLTYGIPVITSDIEVCHEFFEDKDNVALIDNNNMNIDIKSIRDSLIKKVPFKKETSFFGENTISKEVDIIKNQQ